MSNEFEEKVPGATLYLRKSSYTGTKDQTSVEVVLDCQVNDFEVWQTVEAKLKEGFRVFTVPDFHIEVADVLRMELKEARDRVIALERKLAQVEFEKGQESARLKKYDDLLGKFGQALPRG